MFHWYGLLIGLGILAGYSAAERAARHIGKQVEKDVSSLFLWMFFGGLIGARVYHVITDWRLYTNASVIDLLAVWNGGLGIFGAVLGAVLACVLYMCLRKKPARNMVIYIDLLGLGFPIGQAIGRWGNFINQELYGLPTTAPWGIVIDVAHRLPGYEMVAKYHPLFLYESAALFVLWLVLWKWAARKKFKRVGTGSIFGMYLIGYGLIRFFAEFLRLDSVSAGVFSVAQVVSVGFLCIGAAMIVLRNTRT